MGHTRAGTWTEERVALFNEIHAQSPRAIWLALNALPGRVVTKSAVMGRRDRLHGMVRRPKKSPEEKAASLRSRMDRTNEKKRVERAAATRSMPFRVKVWLEQPESADKPEVFTGPHNVHGVAALESNHCRFPLNDDMANPVFCGSQIVHGSYCSSHCRIAFRPAEQRRLAA